MPQAYIGRQPIFDRNMDVYGYEMLYRSEKKVNAAEFFDGNLATSQVILNIFMEIGLENIVDNKPAFINLTREFVTGENSIPFGPEQVVLEILEDIDADEELVKSIIKLSNAGYTIALDDYVPNSGKDHLIEHVDIIKFELPAIPKDELASHVERLKQYDVKILAEKVETQEEHDHCLELGFDLFQGYFFCKPKVITTGRLPENKLAVMQLLTKMQDPEVEIKELEVLISQNISLSYKILRYINSAAFSLNTRIESIDRAISYIGLQTIKQWVIIMSLAGINDKPEEILETALIRSKMCEILSKKLNKGDTGSYTTTGLLSIIDALMDKPMQEVLDELPLADKINRALLEKTGDIGEILSSVILYEQGYFYSLEERGLDLDMMQKAYFEAIAWAKDIRSSFTSGN